MTCSRHGQRNCFRCLPGARPRPDPELSSKGLATARREYVSGSRWAVWRWTFTPSGYLTRLHLVKTPWFSVYLHWLNTPDPEPWQHDHPVTFLSLILQGHYWEVRGLRYHCRWLYNWMRATDAHRIVSVSHVVTLVVAGPVTRRWGFYTDTGWVSWKVYNKRKYKETR